MLKLVIGNKNYSSWSLRAWLYLRESGVPFEEIRIPLFSGPGWRDRLAEYTPAGRVPVIVDGDLSVWDSLAICEYVREKETGAVDWPFDARARAHARSVSAEMHSGFLGIRNELPQNIRARRTFELSKLSEGCRAEIGRIDQLWRDARESYGAEGPWLFGRFSIADVMYAPVALRLVTYSIALSSEAQHFVDQVQALDSIREWSRQAAEERESLHFIDEVVPVSDAPSNRG
jgi:glutathione S-transferase